MTELEQLREQNRKMRKALEFYADRDNHKGAGFSPVNRVDDDCGDIARAVLQSSSAPTAEPAPAEVLNAPEPEWKKYEGDWNAASNPSDPGCFRIRDGQLLWINHITGESRQSSSNLDSVIKMIKSGYLVSNRWPIPTPQSKTECSKESR